MFGDPPEEVVVTTEGVTVGSAEDCDVVLADPEVAAHHCRFRLQGTDVVIEDLGSRHGTFVDGQRCRFRALVGGEVVRLGGARIAYHPSR